MRDGKLMMLQLTHFANMVKDCLKPTLCLEKEKALDYSANVAAFTSRTYCNLGIRKRSTESITWRRC